MLDDIFSGLDDDTSDVLLPADSDTGTTTPSDDTLQSLQSSAPLSLGDFDFDTFSTPTNVKFGKKQRHKVHELPGGARFVDALGPTFDDITWSGILLGLDRTQRKNTLWAMIDAGDAVALAWGGLNLDVLPVDISFSDHDGYTDYTCTCVVLSITSVSSSDVSDYSAVTDDVANAQAAAPDSDAQDDLGDLSGVLKTISTSPLSLTNPTITGLLSSSLATMQAEVSSAASILRSVPQITTTNRSTADAISDITSGIDALTTMTTSGLGAAYIQRSLNVVVGSI